MAETFKSKEKILVHLLDNMDFYDHYTKPLSVTQSGISERADLKQNTISYALKDLKESGLVEEKTSRVEDKKQRMKTYFLTGEGVKKAKKVREEMEESPVDINMYGEKRRVKAKNVNDYIPPDLDLLDIILKGEDGGIKFKVGDKEGSPVNHTRELPVEVSVENLDISRLEEWYKNGADIGVVKGSFPSLLSAFTRRFEEETNIFYFKVGSQKKPIDFWHSLARFLEEIGRVNLSSHREFEEWLNDRESLKKLKKDLEYTSALMIFDGLEHDREMKDLILDITEEISRYGHIRVLIALEEGDIERSMEDASEIIVEETASLYPELTDISSLQMGLEESLALGYLSIFREPVRKDELLRIDAIDEKKLEEVLESPFIVECGEGTVTMPESVKKKKREMTSEKTRKDLHFLAAKYYEENDIRGRDTLERLYHLLRSEEIENAVSLLEERGLEIISNGYAGPLLDILQFYEEEDDHPEFEYYKAEAERASRSFEESREGFERVLECSEEETWRLKAYIGLGKVDEKLGKYDESIYYLNKAEKVAKGRSNPSDLKDQLGKIYARRGEVWNKLDEYEKARKDLKRAIEILVDEEDHHLLTSSYFILARMEKSLGEIEDAIEPFKMGLKSWSRLDRSMDDMVGRRKAGTLYKVLRELEDADVRFREEYSLEGIGPVQEEYEDMKAAALLSLAECHMEDGSFEEAIRTAEGARASLLEEDKMEMAFTEALLGRAYLETERYMKAQDHLSKAIALYNELDQPYKLGLTYFSMAKAKEESGDADAVEKYYRKAVLSLSKSGAEQDAEKVKREIESVPISM